MASEWLINELRIAHQLSTDWGKFPEPERAKRIKEQCVNCNKNNGVDCNPLENNCYYETEE